MLVAILLLIDDSCHMDGLSWAIDGTVGIDDAVFLRFLFLGIIEGVPQPFGGTGFVGGSKGIVLQVVTALGFIEVFAIGIGGDGHHLPLLT